ncbi:MAG TPA: hypothetical protein PL185_00660 [Flavobacteriales bacterium]|nr:hypothetical protein [Flavobacteriales bacterium]
MRKIQLLLLMIFGLLAGQKLLAQTDATDPQVICVGETRPYRVDYLENGGAGTTGSTYAWSILTPGFLGTISTNQGPGASSNAISINWGATAPGLYVLQVIETNSGCPGAPMQLNIQLTPLITPTFDPIGPLCQNSVAPTLPTSSTNSPAITGTWDAAISTTTVGTVVYTFTPAAGQCATTTTLSVTVTDQITPTFAAIGPLCQNSSAPALPTSSTNIPAITGTWDAAISTTSTGTTVYTFTPDAGQCAGTATMSVDVTPQVTPTFTQIGPLCQNSAAPVLPTSSTNIPAITGTWDAVLSTTSAGTVVYTFTPTAGQCATTATMSVTVDPLITPTFAAIGPLCQNSVAPVLPTSSTNIPAITGTWDAVLSTVSAGTVVYTFTPTAGQCATTQTMSVVVNPQITPTFTQIGPLCQNSVAPVLPTSSTNIPAITGTWDAVLSTASAGTVVYTFTPTAGQCATTTTMSVTVDPLVTPTFAAIGPLCQNSVAPTLPTSSTNVPAITGTWDAVLSTASAGTVVYTFTPDAGQCASTATLSVVVNPTPTITIANGPTCSVDLLTWSVDVTVSSGTVTSTSGTVTNPTGNNWTIAGVAAGVNITLTVTDNGCDNTLVINAPNCNCPTVAAPIGTDEDYCIGASTIPGLTATILAGQTLNWYDAASGGTLVGTGSPFVPAAPGTYYAEAVDNTTLCVSQRTAVTLTENPLPVVNALGDATLCQGESTTLSATGALTYVWSPTTGLSPTTGTPVTATPPVGTITYTVTGTDGNGCENTDTVTVIVNPTPTTSPIYHD